MSILTAPDVTGWCNANHVLSDPWQHGPAPHSVSGGDKILSKRSLQVATHRANTLTISLATLFSALHESHYSKAAFFCNVFSRA